MSSQDEIVGLIRLLDIDLGNDASNKRKTDFAYEELKKSLNVRDGKVDVQFDWLVVLMKRLLREGKNER